MNFLTFERAELARKDPENIDWEDFNEVVNVYFKSKKTGKFIKYQLNLISIKHLESQESIGQYYQYYVVQEYYTLPAIERHVQGPMRASISSSEEKEIQRLGRYLKFVGIES